MVRSLTTTAALALTIALASGDARAADPTGVWIDKQGDTKIRVTRCGEGICGHVTWLKVPTDGGGKPKTDRHNADPALRSRPLLGVPVLVGMRPNGDGRWSGHIYNADDGKTYISYVSMVGADSINVQGCVLGGLICKSMAWTRTN